MKVSTIKQELNSLAYHGRGIMIGKSADGKKAITAYFIMGRSVNSRNRIFVKEEDGTIRTEPYDVSRVKDPSLIIYSPIRVYENKLIVTNGDQTDTVYNALKVGGTFESALETRCFEPDAPNYTPRISGMMTFADKDFTYKMSILKSVQNVYKRVDYEWRTGEFCDCSAYECTDK